MIVTSATIFDPGGGPQITKGDQWEGGEDGGGALGVNGGVSFYAARGDQGTRLMQQRSYLKKKEEAKTIFVPGGGPQVTKGDQGGGGGDEGCNLEVDGVVSFDAAQGDQQTKFIRCYLKKKDEVETRWQLTIRKKAELIYETLGLPDDPSIVEGYNESMTKCYRIVAAENFDVDNYLPTTEIEIIDLKLESKLTQTEESPQQFRGLTSTKPKKFVELADKLPRDGRRDNCILSEFMQIRESKFSKVTNDNDVINYQTDTDCQSFDTCDDGVNPPQHIQ